MKDHRTIPSEEPARTEFLKQIDEEVSEEGRLFRAMLPGLLQGPLKGRYVVFREGAIQSDHPTMQEAYRAACERFGYYGGMMIDRVEIPKPIYIPARYLPRKT